MFKFKKKSILAITLSIIMAFSIGGCGKKDSTENNTDNTVAVETSADATDGNATTAPSTEAPVDPSSPEAIAEQEAFDQYLWESFEESVVSDTITLHYTLADPEGYGITPPEVTFGGDDISEESIAEDKKETEESLAEIEAFDYELLTYDQRFTYDILHNVLLTNLDFYNYTYLYEPFAYTSGLHSNLPITLSEYIFYSQKDVDDYLKLLELTPEYFGYYLDFERIKSEKGLFMSTNSANEVIRQCNEYIAKPEENLLIETFNDKIGDVDGLTEEQIEAYKQANYDAVMNYIIPTYENVIAVFKELKTTGKNDLGLAHFEGGTDYYKYLLANKTGTDKTPEEVIELLEKYIESTMNELTTLALTNYEAYTNYFTESEDFYQDSDPKGTILYFEDAFSERFPEIPDIDFTITPVHESLIDIVSPAFFMTPPLDAYEQNTIHTNLTSDGAGAIWGTLAHEGIPGHMYQFVYFLSSNPEPIRALLNFNGYQEGWATYVELMSYEYYDGFSEPIYADFERINSALSLLVSARVEIGVNYEGWDLNATRDYLNANGFNGEAAQDIMDYVIAEPANYQMYVLGWLEFEELRTMAMDALGDKFNEQTFHKVLLDAGPCQFFLLREKVEQYINSVN